MARGLRVLVPGATYHVTVRCNNRVFDLGRSECRDVLLYTLKKALQKIPCRIYGLCLMNNHVHYLIECAELPRFMHYVNWYSAMALNRMLGRSGHFWEGRYYSEPITDDRRALYTLRYIHGNPKSARIRRGFWYGWSNYGSYDRLSLDGLTEWHLAFLRIASTLSGCARGYRRFCTRYRVKVSPKVERYNWGRVYPALGRNKKANQAQMGFGWCQVQKGSELPLSVTRVAQAFLKANRPP